MVTAELVGKILREYRMGKHMSQELLSGLAGLDRTHYSKIERGLRNPTIDTLFKIAAALDTAPSDIIKRSEHAVKESGAHRGE